MKRTELETRVLGCIGVYLLRESRAVTVDSGGLDADVSPGSYKVRVAPDVKLSEGLGITKWDLRQLLEILSKDLKRGIYLDVEAVFDDDCDMTIRELVDAIYTASSG